MKNLEILSKYCYSASADAERDFIKDIFVDPENFSEIITPRSNNLRLLVGNKGSGKSALLVYLQQKNYEQEIPCVYITPPDILAKDFDPQTSPAVVIRTLVDSLVRAIGIQLIQKHSGLLTEGQRILLQDAIDSGEVTPTTMERIKQVLLPIGKGVTNVNFEKMLVPPIGTVQSRTRAINSIMEKDSSLFYVLLDDIDQIGNAKNQNYYDIIWATILAVRQVSLDLPNVYPIVTMRSEIWRNVQFNDGNRDKLDQIRQMVHNLSPTHEDMKKILLRRLEFCAAKLDIAPAALFEPFFDGRDCAIPGSSARRIWRDFIISSSRERPRDMMQLIYQLADSAVKCGRTRIGNLDVEKVITKYSKERESDLVSENRDLCPQLDAVLRSFVPLKYEMSAQDMRDHLSNLPGRMSIQVNGKTVRSELKGDFFRLWQLLFNLEFITPRMADNTQSNRYSYIRASQDPGLVSEERWNEMQRYTWDIQPCYRYFLKDVHDLSLKTRLFDGDKKKFKGKTLSSVAKKRRH